MSTPPPSPLPTTAPQTSLWVEVTGIWGAGMGTGSSFSRGNSARTPAAPSATSGLPFYPEEGFGLMPQSPAGTCCLCPQLMLAPTWCCFWFMGQELV